MTRLYRSERDKKIFGLCGGLAESFNIDSTILRLIVIIAAFFSGGTVIFLYLIASMVIPKETDLYDRRDRYDDYPPSYGSPRTSTFEKEESPDNIDRMMEDIEKKAMWREIEELREKLRKFEEKEKGENKDERI